MFGDIIQTLLPTCSKTFACRKLPERHSGPVSCLGMKQDLCTSNVAGIKYTSVDCVSYCSTAAFSNWPFYPQSMFFWHNEEKRAIAAHTCSYYNHHCNFLGNTYMRLILVPLRWDLSSQETGHGCAEFGRMPSNPLSSPLLSLASPSLHQFLQSSPQNRQWLVCLTETRGVIIQCIKALS